MDYRIDFSLTQTQPLQSLLVRLAAQDARIALGGSTLVVQSTMRVAPATDGSGAMVTQGATEDAIFVLLRAYFAIVDDPADGVIVTPLGGSRLSMIAITNDPEADFGASPIGFVVSATEILADDRVFASAWSSLTSDEGVFEEFDAPAGMLVETGRQGDEMIFADLIDKTGDNGEPTSFFVFGASPKAVMEQIVLAPAYVAHDPGFLAFELEGDIGSVETVGFDTDKGPGVELRIPLPLSARQAAIAALARRAGVVSGATIHFVTEIDDSEETMLLQPISERGDLGAPFKISLTTF